MFGDQFCNPSNTFGKLPTRFPSAFPKGPKIEKNKSRLKFSIPIEIFNPDWIFNPEPSEFPTKIGVWRVARLKISISIENLNPGGRSWFFSIFGPLGFGTRLRNRATQSATQFLQQLASGRQIFAIRAIRERPFSIRAIWVNTWEKNGNFWFRATRAVFFEPVSAQKLTSRNQVLQFLHSVFFWARATQFWQFLGSDWSIRAIQTTKNWQKLTLEAVFRAERAEKLSPKIAISEDWQKLLMITCNFFGFRELIFWRLQSQLHFLIPSRINSREM